MTKYFYRNGLRIVADMIKNGIITENKLSLDVQEKLNSGSDNKHNYSTDEQIVATWIDGRPIYEVTLNVGSKNLNTSATRIDWSQISDVDMFICGRAYRSSNSEYGNGCVDVFPNKNGEYLEVYANPIMSDCNYITLQYTKTTDSES